MRLHEGLLYCVGSGIAVVENAQCNSEDCTSVFAVELGNGARLRPGEPLQEIPRHPPILTDPCGNRCMDSSVMDGEL